MPYFHTQRVMAASPSINLDAKRTGNPLDYCCPECTMLGPCQFTQEELRDIAKQERKRHEATEEAHDQV